ncbi:hypothetical protein BC828DRAFT_405543 [Blastocladiella britannica]|nr:hypothetical protein BC828DRAFT_405543 [Blastocladiella britannica]
MPAPDLGDLMIVTASPGSGTGFGSPAVTSPAAMGNGSPPSSPASGRLLGGNGVPGAAADSTLPYIPGLRAREARKHMPHMSDKRRGNAAAAVVTNSAHLRGSARPKGFGDAGDAAQVPATGRTSRPGSPKHVIAAESSSKRPSSASPTRRAASAAAGQRGAVPRSAVGSPPTLERTTPAVMSAPSLPTLMTFNAGIAAEGHFSSAGAIEAAPPSIFVGGDILATALFTLPQQLARLASEFISLSESDEVSICIALDALLQVLEDATPARLSGTLLATAEFSHHLVAVVEYGSVAANGKVFALVRELLRVDSTMANVLASFGALGTLLNAASTACIKAPAPPVSGTRRPSSAMSRSPSSLGLAQGTSLRRASSAIGASQVSLSGDLFANRPNSMNVPFPTSPTSPAITSHDFQQKYLMKAEPLLDRSPSAGGEGDQLIESLLSNYLDARFLEYVEKMDKEERTTTVKHLLMLFAKVGRLLTVSAYSVDLEVMAALRKLITETVDVTHAEAAAVYVLDPRTGELVLEDVTLSPLIAPIAPLASIPSSRLGSYSGGLDGPDLVFEPPSRLQLPGTQEPLTIATATPLANSGPLTIPPGSRFAMGRGLASLAIQRCCHINVRSPEDPEWCVIDKEVDAFGIPGVVISGVMAIPLRSSDGRPIGCLVALNKLQTPGEAQTNVVKQVLLSKNLDQVVIEEQRVTEGGSKLPTGVKRVPFDAEGEFLFRILRIQAEMILANAASYADMRRTQKKVEVLLDTTRSLSSQLELSALIQEIMRGARELLGADRCTLFLLDVEKKELWSEIPNKEGKMAHIRFPSTVGIAGAVATSGMPINIADAYADSRFNKDVDKTTGYRTTSILCMPIKNADGGIVGVTQMINKLSGIFTEDDEMLLDAFSAQAAVAIEKSVLFQQTESMRDYLDSILQSLSPCVLSLSPVLFMNTINRDWLITFLGTSRDAMESKPIGAWIGDQNSMMLADINSVLATGQSVYSADYELHGSRAGETKVVNYNIVKHIGGQGVVVIIEDISNERRALSTLSRYMSPELAKMVMQEGSAQLGGVRKTVSVLFSDIRSFTEISEALKPHQVVELLNEHFTHCVNAIVAEQGILDKFIGDAIMAVFGVPFVSADDAIHACNTALRIVTDLATWNETRQSQGLKTINIGIGINTGEVLSGNIGSEKRMEFSCIGDAVNLSSRVEGLTKYYGVTILITENTKSETRNLFVTRELDKVCPVGKKVPIVMYELVARVGDTVDPLKAQQVAYYETALQQYYAAQFSDAANSFRQVLNLVVLASIAALAGTVAHAHMMMSVPPPRQWKTNPGPGGEIDYSYTAPLGVFPCKGYPAQAPVTTVEAGSSIPVTLSGGAPHDGGHCQFALSYDNDKTFVVVSTIIRDCMRYANPAQLSVPIPPTAPSGRATLAWAWINAVGNREYYMNCADIQITGGSGPSGSLIGPQLLVADLPGSAFTFPEFGGSAPDYRAKFDERPLITVTGSGGGGSGPATTATATSVTPSATATTTDDAVATVTEYVTNTVTVTVVVDDKTGATTTDGPSSYTPTATSISTPTAISTPMATECAAGAYACSADGSQYGQCANSAWVWRNAPAGTRCVPVGATGITWAHL